VIDIDHRSAPISTLNAQATTVIGRSQLMFSPSKAIIAGALVLATCGVVLVPLSSAAQSGSPAASEDVAPTWVTGTIQPVDGSCSRLGASDDVGVRHSAYECTDTWTASDPRLTGDASRPWNEDTYQTDGGEVSVGIEASHLQNEGGGWACWFEYVQQGATPDHSILEGPFTCKGSGGYDGLMAVLVTTPKTGTEASEFVGLIFAGDLPAVPEAPAAG
jgi:hypothetical protein